ncbi:MAG: hypothetical protein JXQ73_23385 [Phycisphaerae bacterium]|nr:hypothetical protein [Phycisphaerae bacterium]
MSTQPPTVQKVCRLCGEDCAERPRVKDHKGRYYCRACYVKAWQKLETRQAQEGGEDMLVKPEWVPHADQHEKTVRVGSLTSHEGEEAPGPGPGSHIPPEEARAAASPS